MEEKPHWMLDHEESDAKNFAEIHTALARIEGKIDPIYEAYTSATTLGKWLMATSVFVSVITGIILSIKALIK